MPETCPQILHRICRENSVSFCMTDCELHTIDCRFTVVRPEHVPCLCAFDTTSYDLRDAGLWRWLRVRTLDTLERFQADVRKHGFKSQSSQDQQRGGATRIPFPNHTAREVTEKDGRTETFVRPLDVLFRQTRSSTNESYITLAMDTLT